MVPAAQAWVKNASLKGDQVFRMFPFPFVTVTEESYRILLLLVVRGLENIQRYMEAWIALSMRY